MQILVPYGLLQVKADFILSYWIKKAQGFIVPIALKRLLPEHAHKVFDEIHVGT
jgi:hypothetical protein